MADGCTTSISVLDVWQRPRNEFTPVSLLAPIVYADVLSPADNMLGRHESRYSAMIFTLITIWEVFSFRKYSPNKNSVN